MSPIRLFIVDDHHVVRMGLQSMLSREPDIHVIGTAETAAEALATLEHLDCDVLLTDLRMPDVSGDSLLAQLRKVKPALRSVVLTNYHSDEDVFSAIRSGAM